MSTTTTPATPTASPQTTSSSGRATGAAVHEDLYKTTADPAAERERLRGEARTLGLGFFVFFSLIIGGLSLVFNGLLLRGHVAQVQAPARERPDDDVLRLLAERAGHARPASGKAAAATWSVRWSDGQSTPVQLVDLHDIDDDDPKGQDLRGLTRVRIQARDERDRIDAVAALWTSDRPGQRVVEVSIPLLAGGDAVPDGASALPARPSATHALRDAKLLWRTVPTHYVISIGAAMGLLGVLVPGLLIPFYRFWMRFVAAPLGWFNTRLILGVVFFVMFTPMAFALWLRRLVKPESDALGRAERPGSYWKQRAQKRSPKHFERTF